MADAFFDIVVVGTHLSGLAYGALCAKQGYTVLVVGQGARPATYTMGSALMFRSNPLLTGFNSSAVLHSFFRDIGLLAEMRNRPTRLDPYLQVVTPGVRFDLSDKENLNREELERAFPDGVQELERFLHAAMRDSKEMQAFLDDLPLLPPKGFFARRRLKRLIGNHEVFADTQDALAFPGELRFGSPISSLLFFLSRLHAKPMSPFVVRRLLQQALGGFYEFPQGVDGLKRLFTDRILANGGAYWPERSVEQILLKGRKQAASVVVHRPRRTVGLRLLVGNCNPRGFFALVPQEQQNPQFHGAVKALQPAWYHYVVNFAVQPDLIPESMARNLLLSLYPKQETSGPNVLWVYTRMPESYEEDKPATLVVTTRLEARDLPLEGPQFDAINQRILHALEWVLPFIREKLVKVHTPYLSMERDTDEGRLDPAEVHEVYDSHWDGCLEMSALPSQTCYKNVLLLGDHYLGALGLEGSIMGARQAFAYTTDKIVLKQIIKK